LDIPNVFDDNDLMERDFGKASGLTYSERDALFPDGEFEGQEDWDALRSRVCGAVTRNADKFYPKDIIAVSHGAAINSVLAELSGRSIGTGKTRLKNACINMLEYDGNSYKIVFYNKTYDEINVGVIDDG
jgi:uncharacterized phosphatase